MEDKEKGDANVCFDLYVINTY